MYEWKGGCESENNTNAPVSYEAIGYTQRRFLGGEETVLRNLPTPVTVTFVRQDRASRCNSHIHPARIVRGIVG